MSIHPTRFFSCFFVFVVDYKREKGFEMNCEKTSYCIRRKAQELTLAIELNSKSMTTSDVLKLHNATMEQTTLNSQIRKE